MDGLRLSRITRPQRLRYKSGTDSMPKDGAKVDGLIELIRM